MLHVLIFKINIEGHTEGNGFIPLGAPFSQRCARQDAGLGRLGSSVPRLRVRAPWGSAALPGGLVWGDGEQGCWLARRSCAVCWELVEGGRGGSWPPPWRRRFLFELPSDLGIWEFSSVYLFMWEKGSTRSLSYTCLCKNAKGRVVFFISILFFY